MDKTAESLSLEMPIPYSQYPLAGPCAEHRSLLSDRSRSCAGSNRPSSQLTLRTCSQTSRGHTKPFGATSVCHWVAFQTWVGGDVQAALGTGGLTNSAETTVHLLLTSGDGPSHVATRGDATVLDVVDDYALCISDDDLICWLSFTEWVSEQSFTSDSTHNRSFLRRVFPDNHLHWYW